MCQNPVAERGSEFMLLSSKSDASQSDGLDKHRDKHGVAVVSYTGNG